METRAPLPRRDRGHGKPEAARPAYDEDGVAFERDQRDPESREKCEHNELIVGRGGNKSSQARLVVARSSNEPSSARFSGEPKK